MNTEQWFEKATAYFGGAMTAKEEQLFESETAASEELSQLMQLWKTMDAEAAVYEQNKESATAFVKAHQKLKAEFVTEQAANGSSPNADVTAITAAKSGSSAWKWVAMAAVVAGIIFMIRLSVPSSEKNVPVAHNTGKDSIKTATKDSAINLARENKDTGRATTKPEENTISPEVMYAQAFSPDEVPENPNGPLDDAFFYYASGQYKNAISAIDLAANKAPARGNNTFTPLTKFYASYYKALSMMSLGNTSGAIPLLQKSLSQSPSESLRAKPQWYLALSYIKEQEITPAIETLQSLVNNPAAGSYKNKAEKLLGALKEK